MSVKVLIFIAMGGALGAVSRYLSVVLVGRLFDSAMPLGTLAVNIVGSFVMGMLVPWIGSGMVVDPAMRALMTVGFLGAFTTFSTFSMDAVLLLQQGNHILAGAYMTLSVLGAVGAFMAGYALMRGFVS
ncbi:fluoride efflux transporter CrcB [Kiloniella sp. b19]|uniref:fluoride efflux transporter CrcB n=1 Tax=Kiloniella sp. GXU_MW_B19 TaxID=3141326 RepID=UPI0031DF21AB